MPGLVIPQELQKITPIIRRAEELDKNKDNAESQFVSYYCYQYAVLKGIGLAKSVDGKKVLGSLLSMLEGKKEAMSSFTRDEAKFLCLKFANSVFDKADMEDRAGAATDNTSRTFYAAGTFFEIMQQFYEDDDESEELAEIKKKQLYSKWKALEIRKALKAGEKPKPGGYAENQNAVYEEDNEQGGNNTKSGNVEMSKQDGGEMAIETDATVTVSIPSVESDSNNGDDEDDDGVEDLTPTISAAEALAKDTGDDQEEEEEEEGTEVALGPPPAYPTDLSPSPEMPGVPPPAPTAAIAPVVTKPPLTFALPPAVPPRALVPVPAPAPKKKAGFLGFGGSGVGAEKNKKITKEEFDDATELTRFALKALQEKDADLAVQRLKEALKYLGH